MAINESCSWRSAPPDGESALHTTGGDVHVPQMDVMRDKTWRGCGGATQGGPHTRTKIDDKCQRGRQRMWKSRRMNHNDGKIISTAHDPVEDSSTQHVSCNQAVVFKTPQFSPFSPAL